MTRKKSRRQQELRDDAWNRKRANMARKRKLKQQQEQAEYDVRNIRKYEGMPEDMPRYRQGKTYPKEWLPSKGGPLKSKPHPNPEYHELIRKLYRGNDDED